MKAKDTIDLNALIREGYHLSFNSLRVVVDRERKIVFFLPIGEQVTQFMIDQVQVRRDLAMKVNEEQS